MDVIPASVDEIALFKQAAADYYKQAGIPPDKADQLFEAYLSKVAGEMGLTASKVDTLATKIAAELGRTRQTK